MTYIYIYNFLRLSNPSAHESRTRARVYAMLDGLSCVCKRKRCGLSARKKKYEIEEEGGIEREDKFERPRIHTHARTYLYMYTEPSN